jgi:hypothetical protein
MKNHKVPVQSLIDHIKTAADVDDWAKEMAEELLKRDIRMAPVTDHVRSKRCPVCMVILKGRYCQDCGQAVIYDE